MKPTWKKLLAENRVTCQSTNKKEIDELLSMAKRNLKGASVRGLSLEGRFEFAYNTARLLVTVAVRAEGYRVKVTGGYHFNTFNTLGVAMGPSAKKIAIYFEQCRRKRNNFLYDSPNVVSETEGGELLKETQKFEEQLRAWLIKSHPNVV